MDYNLFIKGTYYCRYGLVLKWGSESAAKGFLCLENGA